MTVRLPQKIENITDANLCSGLEGLVARLRDLRDAPEKPEWVQTEVLHRFEVVVQPVAIFPWLSAQDDAHKIYWSEREGNFECAGLGEADVVAFRGKIEFSELFQRLRRNRNITECDAKYFGGMRFNPDQSPDSDWKPFAACRFSLPQVELFQENGKYRVACNLKVDAVQSLKKSVDGLIKKIQSLKNSDLSALPELPEILGREDIPSAEEWTAGIEAALEAFDLNKLLKVVLARKLSFSFAGTVNPLSILEKLRSPALNLFHFCFQPDSNHAYIGASPERLYFRSQTTLLSEAIAGTRPRSDSTRKDLMWGAELQNCEKDIREHRFVVEYLREVFQDLCRYYTCDDVPRLLKLKNVQHLFTGFEGRLNPDVDDDLLLARFHPTPAVGGLPKMDAIRMISETESFDRGWYTGPVGWVGKDSASFAVAIRSGLVVKNKLHLFSGAGIVKGSKPCEEWEEIENKISNFLKVIDA